jgi:hypothetical protein
MPTWQRMRQWQACGGCKGYEEPLCAAMRIVAIPIYIQLRACRQSRRLRQSSCAVLPATVIYHDGARYKGESV